MKRLALVAGLGLLTACGDSTGSVQSPWLGVWSIQVANAPGWVVSPPSSVLSLRDSTGKVFAVVPAVAVSDSGYTDPVSFTQAFAVQNSAGRGDSLSLAVSGQGMNTGFTYLFRLLGTSNGGTASGVLTIELQGFGSPSQVGTWTAVKQ